MPSPPGGQLAVRWPLPALVAEGSNTMLLETTPAGPCWLRAPSGSVVARRAGHALGAGQTGWSLRPGGTTGASWALTGYVTGFDVIRVLSQGPANGRQSWQADFAHRYLDSAISKQSVGGNRARENSSTMIMRVHRQARTTSVPSKMFPRDCFPSTTGSAVSRGKEPATLHGSSTRLWSSISACWQQRYWRTLLR